MFKARRCQTSLSQCDCGNELDNLFYVSDKKFRDPIPYLKNLLYSSNNKDIDFITT